MISRQTSTLIRRICTLCAVDESAHSDAELVERFARGDEPAFETLLNRHGPMILRVCRRLLPSEHDAEDVFQATFLILARNVSSLRKTASVGPWLFGTACRIATKCRAAAGRRGRREAAGSVEISAAPDELLNRLSAREAAKILHEELAQLPQKYRDAIVLCHLQGKTRDEAAGELGCPLGTLKDRLLRGKELLWIRLTRRGVSLSTAMLAGLLSETVCPAAMSEALARVTIQAVFEPAQRLSASVADLLSAGLRSTRVFPMKLTAALTVTALAIGATVGLEKLSTNATANNSTLHQVAEAGPSPPENAKESSTKRVDALGDALPDGVIMRLGTRRFREPIWPWSPRPVSWQSRPDGKSYLIPHHGVNASEIRRIDAKTGVIVESWPIGKSRGDLAWASQDDTVVGFSPDGRYVLLTNDYIEHGVLVDPPQEWRLTLYDLTERKQVWSNTKQLKPQDWPGIGQCVFSANNKWIVTARRENEIIRLWDAQTGKQVWEHQSKGQSLAPLGFVDDGETVVAHGDNDGAIYLFDRAKGTEKKSFPLAAPQSWGETLLSPDGKLVITCTTQPPSIWDMQGKKVAELEGHKEWANRAAFSPDGKKLFTGCFDTFVIEREWPSGKPIRKIELGHDRVQRLGVSPDGKRLEVVFEGEQALLFFDLETGKQLPEAIDSHRSTVYGVECAPDGSLVSFGCDRSVRTWDLKQRKSVAQFAVELDQNGGTFALSADGTRVAVPNSDVKSIGIYERLTGKRLRNIPTDHFGCQQLAFSPDGRFLAAISSHNRTAQVWDVDTGASVLKVRAGNVCNSVAGAFSHDGRTFAFGDGEQVRIWDTAAWKEGIGIRVVAPWGWAPSGLQFSPDGRMIATASEFGDGVRLYEVTTRRERAHIHPPRSTSGMLRFSHNGRLLAWVNDHNKIHVLDLQTGVLAGPFTGHDGAITGLAFTIDDKALASSSGDCTILVWDLSTNKVAKTAPADDANQDWQALRGDDAQKAFTAIRALAANPMAALKIASEHLKPVEPIDPQWAAARLRDLDSQKFAERERATRELEESGDRVAATLERFLAAKPSAEASERVEKILAKLRGREAAGELAQSLRALEMLEWIGTAKARELVEKLAKGAEGALLTEEAKRSLKRWKASAE